MVVFDGMSLIAKPDVFSTVSFFITRVLFTQGFSAFSIPCSHTPLLQSYRNEDNLLNLFIGSYCINASRSWRLCSLRLRLCRLVTGIVGSNLARGMGVCPRLSVLCYPV
jgi:hypothetical protein